MLIDGWSPMGALRLVMNNRVAHMGPGTRHCYRLTDFKGLDAQVKG